MILPPTGYHFVDGPTIEWYDAPILRMADGVMDTLLSLRFARKGRNHLLSPFGWTRVSGDRLIHARGDEHVVRWYTFGGALAQVSRWTRPRIAATDSVWARMGEELRGAGRYAEMTDEESRETLEEWRSQAFAHLPTDTDLHGDPLAVERNEFDVPAAVAYRFSRVQ